MKVHHGIHTLPAFNHTVLTIGTFDGFHKGHQSIIDRLNQIARSEQSQSVLITFEPHPRNFFGKEKVLLLSTLQEKLALIGEKGPDHLVIVNFDEAFSSLSADEYILNFLVACFHPHSIVIGYDHRFGRDRSGGLDLLQAYSKRCGYSVHEISKQTVDEIAVSSTKIRNALEAGFVDRAAQWLGRNYTLQGSVIHGEKKGRELGFPTANLGEIDALKLIPKDGVYAVRVSFPDRGDTMSYPAMMNIGNRPVFESFGRALEVHLFDFHEDIYGERIEVEWIARLRDELAFHSEAELIQNMKEDERISRQLLIRNSPKS